MTFIREGTLYWCSTSTQLQLHQLLHCRALAYSIEQRRDCDRQITKMNQAITNRVHSKNDQSSLSNPSLAISTNMHLDWVLDFDQRTISGTCKHSVTVLVTGTVTVDFDSSKLKITSVLIDGTAATFEIAAVDVQLGSKVSVTIPKVNPELSENVPPSL